MFVKLQGMHQAVAVQVFVMWRMVSFNTSNTRNDILSLRPSSNFCSNPVSTLVNWHLLTTRMERTWNENSQCLHNTPTLMTFCYQMKIYSVPVEIREEHE